jgi:hypothetical protein
MRLPVQAKMHYKAACTLKPAAMQPYYGLAQLYHRSGDATRHAETLQHILENASQTPAAAATTRQQLAQALLDSHQPAKAALVVAAIVREFVAQHGESTDLPPEIIILQADVQIALDEVEFESRLRARLQEVHSQEPNNVSDAGRRVALAQEVGASWVLFRCHCSLSSPVPGCLAARPEDSGTKSGVRRSYSTGLQHVGLSMKSSMLHDVPNTCSWCDVHVELGARSVGATPDMPLCRLCFELKCRSLHG